MNAAAGSASVSSTWLRARRLERALFRGAELTLDNADYRRSVRFLADELLHADISPADLTVAALQLGGRPASAAIIAREAGVVAGLQECGLLAREFGGDVQFVKQDGDAVTDSDALIRLEGDRGNLLSLERVALNIVQRLSGIATATRRLQDRVTAVNSIARVVGTRKTPWGLLDKRALHLGGGGTHRLGLGDAILVKNNHLALMGPNEELAATASVAAAWKFRDRAVFIEVEVRSAGSAMAVAQAFRQAQTRDGQEDYPCLILLDNMEPRQIGELVDILRKARLWDGVLIEASGGISEANIEAYAVSGADAISIGALTHSVRALDVSQTISSFSSLQEKN